MIELAGSAAHVFAADFEALELDDADLHHLTRVLRLRTGERVSVADGSGRWRWARWAGAGLVEDGPIHQEPPPAYRVGVGVALVKGDRLDWAVEKLTEVGVDVIVPIQAARCVVTWTGDRIDSHLARLRRIARAAAMQSRRVRLPEVAALTPLAVALAQPGARRADFDGPPLAEVLPAPSMVVVGPEGGWDATEREAAPQTVRLSEQVLRVETAAVVAGVGLLARRAAGVGEPAPRQL